MSISEKVTEIKRIVTLVCDVIPAIVSVVKEVLILLKDIKTV